MPPPDASAAKMADPAPGAAPAAAASAFGAGTKRKGSEKKEYEKRTHLKNLDTIATKAFDPYGVSVIDDVSLEMLWGIVRKGDHFAKFFNELAANDDNCPDAKYRVGIGISRFCETMENCIVAWEEHADLRAMMLPNVVKRIDAEAKDLLPHMKALNLGKGGPPSDKADTFRAVKARKAGGAASTKTPPTEPVMTAAVAKLFEFLQKGTDSNLRMAISFLSTGGVFYATATLDKTARAWLAHADPTPDAAFAMSCLKARADVSKGPAASTKFERERATGDLLKK